MKRLNIKLIETLFIFFTLSFSIIGFTYDAAKLVQVKFITNQGEFVVELYPQKAPKTVANFLKYVDEGFYNGTIFHRVIKGFMIQGGGFDEEFEKKKTHKAIKNESNNGLKNQKATIAMARTNNIHSATAQFFINTKNNGFLDYKYGRHGYAVFGKVIKGYDVVSKIEGLPTGRYQGYRDVPQKQVVIKQVVRL